jgi:hypothetical protein
MKTRFSALVSRRPELLVLACALCTGLGASAPATPASTAKTSAAPMLDGTRAPLGSPVVVDPDPELFDGTRTKIDEKKQDEPKVTIDDWEGPNIIVYDQEGQGSAQGGMGRLGGTTPGMEIGSQSGGMGGLPVPMMGGGGASDKQGKPGVPPMATQSAQIPEGKQGAPGGVESTTPPAEVAIGDSQQTINQVRQGRPPGSVDADPGEAGEKVPNEDTTRVENAASGRQSGGRGGGVEQGDAMPPEI